MERCNLCNLEGEEDLFSCTMCSGNVCTNCSTSLSKDDWTCKTCVMDAIRMLDWNRVEFHQLVITHIEDDYKVSDTRLEINTPVRDRNECLGWVYDKINVTAKENDWEDNIPEQYRLEYQPLDPVPNYTYYKVSEEFKFDTEALRDVWDIIMVGEFIPLIMDFEIKTFTLSL